MSTGWMGDLVLTELLEAEPSSPSQLPARDTAHGRQLCNTRKLRVTVMLRRNEGKGFLFVCLSVSSAPANN